MGSIILCWRIEDRRYQQKLGRSGLIREIKPYDLLYIFQLAGPYRLAELIAVACDATAAGGDAAALKAAAQDWLSCVGCCAEKAVNSSRS